MTGTAERKARLAIERTQLKLKREQIAVEAERRAIARERAEAIIFLRLLCERYGDLHWSDDDTLLTILDRHLADPLAERIETMTRQLADLQQTVRVLDQQSLRRLPVPTSVPEPAPAPPAPVPCAVTIVPGLTESGRPGSVTRCRCGWETRTACPSEIEATLAGQHHLAKAPPATIPRTSTITRRAHHA